MTNFWQEKITIGALSIPRFMSAPMDGITDSPFRQIVRDFSPKELLWGEMRHVASISAPINIHTEKALYFNPIEQPLGFQFSANTLDYIEKAVERVIERKFALINLNCGCPARRVVGSGSGSALMANVPTLRKILALFMKTINNQVPMTIKIRAGFREKNALDIVKIAQDLGVACIIIHPRTQSEEFSGDLDFDLAKKVKETVSVPVIFSGDITNFQRAKLTHEHTGVDGFMIGRALMGTPWVISQMVEESQNRTFSVSTPDMLECVRKHLDLNINFYGPSGLQPFKKHLSQYIKRINQAAIWRTKLVLSNSVQEIKDILARIAQENQ